MANSENLFVTFYTTAEAMATEEACKSRNIEGKLVPVPRVLSAGCGISWKGNSKDKDITEQALKEDDIEWEEIAIL
ncbi:Protein of unknown function [Peptostreptococcus russellii]|uniref:Putative Se/S carrier protein-like domain-containing protein n=1 Tax=Peptostreptococcus russellii TaxID=215200 RepID=A0A1H8G1V4_9FIRM|nr:DUF3343 domain-containing protein [Peptostreptococcus russellii]SEN38091.1 Protein of unknown function [Peptostreptococcus russellii]